jgi:NADH pyrophosphatase NudC (nudix superfamily)
LFGLSKKDAKAESIIAQEEEVSNVKWFNIDEINELIKNNLFLSLHIEFYYDCINYLNAIIDKY